jgi:hypothetical protein
VVGQRVESGLPIAFRPAIDPRRVDGRPAVVAGRTPVGIIPRSIGTEDVAYGKIATIDRTAGNGRCETAHEDGEVTVETDHTSPDPRGPPGAQRKIGGVRGDGAGL